MKNRIKKTKLIEVKGVSKLNIKEMNDIKGGANIQLTSAMRSNLSSL